MALQIHRRVGGAAGAPATLVAGQLAYNDNGQELFIGTGTAVEVVVSAARQCELSGTQTLTGNKTIAITALHITGGADGDVLSTDGSGGLDWVGQPPASVIVNAPLTGTGLTANPIALTVATLAQIETGTDNIAPVTALGLRDIMGLDVAHLTTTAQTVVPALNELKGEVDALSGPTRMVGTYDAANHTVTPSSGASPAPAGNLQAAAAANTGWVLIVNVAGTGAAPAPAIAMSPGDWLVSDGTAWVHIALSAPALVASNVDITAITGLTATDVQGALEDIIAGGVVPVEINTATMSGNGTTATPLSALLDDGTYVLAIFALGPSLLACCAHLGSLLC